MTSDKMNKTRRVEVERLFPHPKYGKFLKRRTVCHAHDEGNDHSTSATSSRSWKRAPCRSSSGGGSSGSSDRGPSRPSPVKAKPPQVAAAKP